MILGTFGAGTSATTTAPGSASSAPSSSGALGGCLHAIATVIFGVDHIVSGVAINIIALGATQYLAAITFTGLPGGGPTQSPPLPDLPALTIEPLADSARATWRSRTSSSSPTSPRCCGRWSTTCRSWWSSRCCWCSLTWFLLWRTPFGLRLRSCGESPVAAESLGVNVLRYKFVAVLISGGLAGLGGGFLAMVASSDYRDGQTGNRGYIGLAAMIFGNWRPGGAARRARACSATPRR